MPPRDVECAIVGGGPAGMVLGLILSRAGLTVTVLEKHADFLRDFRGDTVHASTLAMLDELGLGPAFKEIDHQVVEKIGVQLDSGTFVMADMTGLPGAHKHIAMAPQAEFLEMLAHAAEQLPNFRLMRSCEVTGVVKSQAGRVTAVQYRDIDGRKQTLAAHLIVGCDGRNSALRDAVGLRPRPFGSSIDVWWFQLPKHPDDPVGLRARVSSRRLMLMLDRGDYYQCGFLIGKGADQAAREGDLSTLTHAIAELVPHFADRVRSLRSWDDIKLLDVRLNRLRRWYVDGALFIGDAAHAMSPLGGVGVNLAVADAAAAARLLANPLLAHCVTTRDLRRVQRRRWIPTVVYQLFQRMAHRRIQRHVPGQAPQIDNHRTPLGAVLMQRFPALCRSAGYAMAIGLMPEHAPEFARPIPDIRNEVAP
ncbi:FAD-dependent oxidoreductase [Mycobacteroides immunogenum]|uniref:FAD-dependent oxidoreductase n=1 Tax=Mycobacteroides immunogenum TaxID=83262 RepID=UPI0025B77FB5|nr:FAD-dependent oxidoreductase [Mycobacteroides immunogenum]WJR33239.1 FAD-dependent oxidoreductase [Mycobacteroides immunogenum]